MIDYSTIDSARESRRGEAQQRKNTVDSSAGAPSEKAGGISADLPPKVVQSGNACVATAEIIPFKKWNGTILKEVAARTVAISEFCCHTRI